MLFGVVLPMILVLAPLAPQDGFLDQAQAAPSCGTTMKSGTVFKRDGRNDGIFTNIPPNAEWSCTESDGSPNINNTITRYYDSNENQIPGMIRTDANGKTKTCLAVGQCTETDIPTDTSCSGSFFFMMSPITCLTRELGIWLGSSLMSLTGWLMALSGNLFNWVLFQTVTQYGDMYRSIQGGITAAWTVFRDIANILIIGIFVFVAISIILGLKEFGQKKLVANIIIIAVLINFSLLFTKMIIDFSNFTATQFHKEVEVNIGGAQPQAGVVAPNPGETPGIAGAFIKMTGVETLGGTYNTLDKIAETKNNGWLALLHGIVSSTLYFIVALVLLYGSYLLIVRSIIFFLLLMTSAVAFATYIIPNKTYVQQGWTTWWNALIKNAILAPVLMIMLWATSVVTDTLSKTIDLGNLASGTPTVASIQYLLNFAIVIGLLFASFYVSSKLSSSIAGFNIPGMIAAGTAGLASRFVAAPIARQFISGPASRRADRLKGEGKEANRLGARALRTYETFKDTNPELAAQAKKAAEEHKSLAAQRGRQAKRMDTVAGSKMNVMDTGTAKTITKSLGLKGFFAGGSAKTTSSYAAAVKARADAAAKVAESVRPDTDKIRMDEDKRARESLHARKAELDAIVGKERATVTLETQNIANLSKERDEKLIKGNEALVDATKGNAAYQAEHSQIENSKDAQKNSADVVKTELQKALVSISDPSKRGALGTEIAGASPSELKKLQEQVLTAVSDPILRETIGRTMKTTMDAHASILRQEDDKIKTAQGTILTKAMSDSGIDKTDYSRTQSELASISTRIDEALARKTTAEGSEATARTSLREERLTDDRAISKRARDEANVVVNSINNIIPETAKEVALQNRDKWKRMLGVETSFDSDVVAAAGSAIKRNRENKRVRDMLNAMRETEPAPETPATPPASGGAKTT